VFQALRIAVNQEMFNLDMFLDSCEHRMSTPSLLMIITFHSLEEQAVSRAYTKWKKLGKGVFERKRPITPE